MSNLKGFSNSGFSNNKTTYVPSRTPSGGSLPPDRDRCPRGWDTDIWFLALLFESLAEEQDIKLRAGRPVIYSELAGRIKDSGIRNMTVPFSCEQLTEVVNQELYPNPVLTGAQWRQFVQIMIYEFWSMHWDENATAKFTEKFMFIDIWDQVVGTVDAQSQS